MAFVIKTLQDRLDSVFPLVTTTSRTRDLCKTTLGLRNPLNTSLLQKRLIDERNQKLDLKLVWNLPECGDVTMGCVTDPCGTGDEPAGQDEMPITLECNATNTHSKAFDFKYSDFEKATVLMDNLPNLTAPLSETSFNGTSVESKLLGLISDIDISCDKAMNKSLINHVDASTFGFSPLEVPSLTTLVADNGKWVTTRGSVPTTTEFRELYSAVIKSANIAQYQNTPILLGGYPLEQYGLLSSNRCCDSNGYNMGDIIAANQTPFIASSHFIEAMIAKYGAAAGDYSNMNMFLSYDAGAMQILNYYDYAGMFEMSTSLVTKKMIKSPFTGRMMGLVIKTSGCGESITVRVQATEDYIYRPETQCAGTAGFGVNGLQQFVIKNS